MPKKARESKKLSQQEVAHYLDIAQKTLSNIESDKSKPTIEQLAKLGEKYEMDILELLTEQGVTFNQHNLTGGENGIVTKYFYYPEKVIEQYEKRIANLEELIASLRKEIAILRK